MRFRLAGVVFWLLAGVSCRDKSSTPGSSDPNLIASAEAFCKLVFEAPKRHLEAKCSPEDKSRDEYNRLLALASRPVAACAAALEPGIAKGRLKLHKAKAEACARAIEAAPWKTSLRTRELNAFSECAGMSTGASAEAAACRTSLDCQPDLWCSGATFQTDGTCQKRVAAGEKCDAPLLFLFDEVSSSCVPGHACDFASFRPAYAVGYPPVVSSELERERSKREPAPENTGSPGFGPKPLTGREAPRIRMGATTVKGRLAPEVIQRVVRQSYGRFRICYEQGLHRDPKLEGRVSVSFAIDRAGSVSNVKADGDLPDKATRDCVASVFFGLSFPKPEGGSVSVVYPIIFSPPEGPAKGLTGPAAVDAGSASEADASTAPAAARVELVEKPRYEPLICIAKVAKGDACVASHECGAGMLCRDGLCEAPGKTSDACAADIECGPELYCGAKVDASGAHGVCKPLGVAGAPCAGSGECRGACADGKCVAFCGAG
jgi:hypothetical protein